MYCRESIGVVCRINWSGVGVDHTFILAYICVYFVCMDHTFIVVLLEWFVELYIVYLERLSPPPVLQIWA